MSGKNGSPDFAAMHRRHRKSEAALKISLVALLFSVMSLTVVLILAFAIVKRDQTAEKDLERSENLRRATEEARQGLRDAKDLGLYPEDGDQQ